MGVATFVGNYEDRVAAALPEGYVVGVSTSGGVIGSDTQVSGVERRRGMQRWQGGNGQWLDVEVEDFDLDEAGLRNWSTGVE